MDPNHEELASALQARLISLDKMLTADGFAIEQRGNRDPRLNVYLDYNYRAPDGRTAQIKFRPGLSREVRLTIRSTF